MGRFGPPGVITQENALAMVEAVSRLIANLEYQRDTLLGRARLIQASHETLQDKLLISRKEFDAMKRENEELKQKVQAIESELRQSRNYFEEKIKQEGEANKLRIDALEAMFRKLQDDAAEGREFAQYASVKATEPDKI